jgi:DNA-binding MarR family transcriptional regulator
MTVSGTSVPGDIRRGVTRLAQRLRAQRPPDGLSSNKLGVLSHLYRHGPSTPGQISAAERQHPQSLTRVFAELEADGLVSRSRSDHDGRAWVLTLRPAGQDALSRDMAHRDEWLAGSLTSLTSAEIVLVHIAAGLLERLADLPASAGPAGAGPASAGPAGTGPAGTGPASESAGYRGTA